MQSYDILLWGATGFTGRLVAEYLAASAPRELRWALGGRDQGKLEAVRAAVRDVAPDADPDLLLGDSLDPASMGALARTSRVVVSTVGPFDRYGTPLLEACAKYGVDYCDITGEMHWIRGNVDRLHQRAVDTGARIVHCCGFDSIPSDLGVWMLHDHVTRNTGRRLARATFYLKKMKGTPSGGTLASMLNLLERVSREPDLRKILGDAYALNPAGQRQGPDGGDQRDARWDEDVQRWTAPFVMAGINTRVVRRTNALLDYPYGRDFRYREVVLSRNRKSALRTARGLKLLMLGGYYRPTRWLMRRFMTPPGSGPSAAERRSGFFEILLLGESDGTSPVEIQGRVRGERDPGYGETSRMLGESALCLALDDLPQRGGILTPASAMGGALLERLRRAGMTFEVLEPA